MRQRSILYLDDDPGNLSVFEMLFLQQYRIFTASNAQQAFDILRSEAIDILLVDQRMPDMSGMEFLEAIQDEHPHLVKLTVTAYADLSNVIQAINRYGVYRYILKPWVREELAQALASAAHLLDMREEREALQTELENANARLSQSLGETQHLNQRLSAYALRFVGLSKRLDQMRDLVGNVNQQLATAQHHGRELNQQLQTIDRADEHWEDFLGLFERMQSDFVQRLQTRYPELTAAERRLCALLRMGLSTKEIASVNNISPQSVNMARYRLRKKLALDDEAPLEQVLLAI